MLNISIDTATLTKDLDEFAQSQAPFAMSRTINKSLIDAQTAIIESATQRFTIRRPRFLKQTMKITKFARKTDLTARLKVSPVGNNPTSDNIFGRHEDGGIKTPTAGKNLAIPLRGIRTSKSGIIPKGQRPRNLKNTFVQESSAGNAVIVQPRGSKKNRVLRAMYLLRPSVRLKQRLGFDSTTYTTFNQVLNTHWNTELAHAIRTARLS